MLYAPLDGLTRCRFCGQLARLDLLSRWMLSCVVAIIPPAVLFAGSVFFSGHLFVVCIVVALGAWRALCFAGFPFLTLERATDVQRVTRRESMLLLAAMLSAAFVLDAFMASRFEVDPPLDSPRAASAAERAR